MTLDAFKGLFKFDKDRAGQVGIERECFIVDGTGTIVPMAATVLKDTLNLEGWQRQDIGYELSACQLEMRAGPCTLQEMPGRIRLVRESVDYYLGIHTLSARYLEVAPETMPLDVYPDPTGRYQRITENMPREILSAACRIIGTHVHVGMPDHETALMTYNCVIKNILGLRMLGDNSNGERLRLYRIVSPNSTPVAFTSWGDFYQHARANDYAMDPRKNWMEIRISTHGTLEFRMFGASESDVETMKWVTACRALCLAAR